MNQEPLPDMTDALRQRPAYERAMEKEKHEKHEFSPIDGSAISLFSCISSPPLAEPVLSLADYYGPVGEIVRLLAPSTEADPTAVYVQLLTGIGNLIGPNPHFFADGASHRVNLFAVVCGKSSKARKGTSWSRVNNILSELDDDWLLQRVKSGVVSGEGVTQVFQTDEDRRLLLLETEFGQVLQAMKREGNTVSVLLRQAWDGTRLAVLRRKDPIQVDGAHISMIGHITVPELHKLLSSTDISNGMANRCLWVYAARSKLLPDGGEAPSLTMPLDQLRIAISDARKRGRLERDASSAFRWSEIYHELSRESPGQLGELLSRGEAQVMRLALLFALLDKATTIRSEHLNAAYSLWKYCEASVTRIFGDRTFSKKAMKILQALATAMPAELTMTQVHRLFGNNASEIELQTALSEVSHLIEIEHQKTGGGRIIRRRSPEGVIR